MPNANTISRLTGTPAGQGLNAIPTYSPTGTSATIVPSAISGQAAMVTVGNANAQPAGASTYGSGFDGFAFKVKVAWRLTTKASCNVTMAIMQASSNTTTYTSGNVIATTGATANDSGSYNGWLEAIVLWDSTYAKLAGYYIGYKNAGTPAAIAQTTITNQVAVTLQSQLNFEIAATFSDTTSGTVLTITEFTAEAY